MKSGLVSVSFRKKGICELIKATKESGLKYIEWGGDVHIPMGNVKLARRVRRLMHGAGLKCASYGSYFGLMYHCDEHFPLPFKKVLKTAKALGAKTIRVWLGWPRCGCKKGCEQYVCQNGYNRAVRITKELCRQTRKFDPTLTLSIECHFATLTDDYHDTLKFISDVNEDNLRLYWQPNHAKGFEYNLEALKALLPWITNVHVFNWDKDAKKYPLCDGTGDWDKYLEVLNDKNEGERICFLEFMPDGELTSLPCEAKTLNKLLDGIKK